MPMKNPVTIVLISDNHGNRDSLEYIRKRHADADYFIHCGDAELPTWLLDGFAVVQGNNDSYNQFPSKKILSIGSHKIYVTHGNRDMFFGHFDMLAEKAKAADCDICFFGHTHIPFDQTINGIRILNPGSIWMNRDGSQPSYMIVTLDHDAVDVKRMTYVREKPKNKRKKHT